MLSARQVGELLGHTHNFIIDEAQDGHIPFTIDHRGNMAFDPNHIREIIISSFTPPPIEPEWGAWFSGLVDGEGHLGIHKSTRPGTHVYTPVFSIGLRIDDIAVLESIHTTLNFGNVYRKKSYTNSQGYVSCPTATFKTDRLRDAYKIMLILDRFPLKTKKHRDFIVWKELVELKQALLWHKKVDRSRMEELYLSIKQLHQDKPEPVFD